MVAVHLPRPVPRLHGWVSQPEDRRMREHWTEEQTKSLEHLMGLGLAPKDIAQRLMISKNAVVGKIHRIRVKWGHAPQTSRKNNMIRTYKGPVIGKRPCNICSRNFKMHSRFDRFCDSCKRRGLYGWFWWKMNYIAYWDAIMDPVNLALKGDYYE